MGARLPVEALRIVPAEANSVIAAEVLARQESGSAWLPATQGAFSKLVRDGATFESPPVEVMNRSARSWMVRVKAGSGTVNAPPTLELHWRPAQVVFVARGEGPFTLAVGNLESKSAILSVSNVVPGYERGAELKLPEARVGEARVERREPSWWRRMGVEAGPRTLALWAVLVGGVLLLGVMAWRTNRAKGHCVIAGDHRINGGHTCPGCAVNRFA